MLASVCLHSGFFKYILYAYNYRIMGRDQVVLFVSQLGFLFPSLYHTHSLTFCLASLQILTLNWRGIISKGSNSALSNDKLHCTHIIPIDILILTQTYMDLNGVNTCMTIWLKPRLRKNFRGGSMSASPFRVTTPQSCTASAAGNANSPMKAGEMVGEAVFFWILWNRACSWRLLGQVRSVQMIDISYIKHAREHHIHGKDTKIWLPFLVC